MARKSLRAVGEEERRADPLSLIEAVTAGDELEMLLAQRRLIAESLVAAAENTRPQLNNELNKLHGLIREAQARRSSSSEGATSGRGSADEAWTAV